MPVKTSVEKRIKGNFIKKIKNKPRRHDDKWKTNFHLIVNSKAFFGLSEPAFKLYCSLILQGKNQFTSLKFLADRVGKSVRQVQRDKKELEENGFLKIVRVMPTKYEYVFDYNGRLLDKKPEVKPIEKEFEIIKNEKNQDLEKQIKVENEVEEISIDKNEDDYILEKTKTIFEYSDFAILHNMFWQLSDDLKKSIREIIKERLIKEPQNKQQLSWINEKINTF